MPTPCRYFAVATATAPAIASATIRERREELGLSQAELARRALVDRGTIWRLETGRDVSDLTRRRIDAALEQAEEQAA